MQELRESGISEAQAAAIAQAVCSAVATHAASKTNVAEFRAEMLARFDSLEAGMKADNAALRADLYRALWMQGGHCRRYGSSGKTPALNSGKGGGGGAGELTARRRGASMEWSHADR